MRGDLQAVRLRQSRIGVPKRWSAWVSQMRRQRRQARVRQLELIDRLETIERGARRAGAYPPKLEAPRRWC